MKIKITSVLPIENPPTIGSVHEVTRIETEPPRHKRTRMYFIEVNGREIGVYPRECEKVFNEDNAAV